MKLDFRFSRNEARSLSITLVAARLLSHIVIDSGYLGSSGWISVLAGTVLVIPLAAVTDARGLVKKNSALVNAGLAAICAIGIFEAAAVLGLVIDTIKCSGILRANEMWIAALTLGGCLYALFKNGAGICNAARIWIFVFLFLLAVIIIAQFRQYKPVWLTPIFGPGVRSLIEGAVSSAGILAAAPLLHSLSEGENTSKHSCVLSVVIAGIAAAVLCVLRGMMAPVITGNDLNRFFTIDMLIANGRGALPLQLPILIAAYGSYIVSIAGYCLVSAAALQRLAKLSGKITAVIIIAGIFALNAADIADRSGIYFVSGWEFIIAGIALLAIIFQRKHKERRATAQ